MVSLAVNMYTAFNADLWSMRRKENYDEDSCLVCIELKLFKYSIVLVVKTRHGLDSGVDSVVT